MYIMRDEPVPLASQSQLKIIFLALIMMMPLSSGTWAESMNEWTINMQDEADNYARWLDHPPKNRNIYGDALVMRKFIYTCTMLKAYSGNDWCSASPLTRRWLGYANQHGFDLEVNGYKQTTPGHFRFPKKILEEIKRAGKNKP